MTELSHCKLQFPVFNSTTAQQLDSKTKFSIKKSQRPFQANAKTLARDKILLKRNELKMRQNFCKQIFLSSRLVLGFMLTSSILSAFIANTSVTAMLMPIGKSLLEKLEKSLEVTFRDEEKKFVNVKKILYFFQLSNKMFFVFTF